ncbi:MAG: ethylbenzene dehydrogenase-related protein [Pseudomonadales bacterium]|nr:ethylbenzene dehydrogenase-related protein [Pseudomonadales bacterium]
MSPLKQIKRSAALVIVVIITVPLFWIVMKATSSHVLVVNTINVDQYIQIDGIADESFWEQALPQTIFTHGGANFEDGATPITIKALQNGNELFMHVEWQDATESLRHLPLVKTDSGWRVQQNGFHHFAETKYYEDKLAIILSENCEFGAAGTAHLGPRPLKDKPKHWTGLGYHYSETDVVDLWHWKAVRTNHMRLMDDNYIGKPDIVREGARRYKAGYKTDARESGAYKMNWKWYSPNGVVPKRLPFNNEWLAPYQSDGNIQEAEIPWVLPWFDGEAYSSLKDNLPIGTVLPSILYTSNQFEGDRAHVRAYAQWQDGKWSLELFRKLNTGSDKDVALRDGLCLWVAAFDHAQIAHTRHVRPIKLRFKP